MPRIRTIKPEFWTDDAVVELPFVTRLVFIGMWNFVDDEGYIENKPRQLKMKILPADQGVLIEDSVSELVASGLVHEFDSDQGPLLRVANWAKHQKINRRNQTRFTGITRKDRPRSVSVPGVVSESHPPEKEKEKEKDQGTTPNGVVARERATTKGTRIPEPFIVTAQMRADMASECPTLDIDHATKQFVDYWRAASGRTAIKKDWVSAWRFWMRKDAHDNPSRPTPTQRAQQTMAAGREVAGRVITTLELEAS